MADSTLTREATIPQRLKGHDTAALGPSDSSDTGSDIATAGADIGDVELDSDTDRAGTGERGALGRDDALPADVSLIVERAVPADDESVDGDAKS